jgi:3-dehydro-L-gulonate 2-dehydrogenase
MKTRIPFEEMQETVCRAFIRAGMPEEKAATCARIHTESSRDGVYSHGLNRVERFVDYLDKGWVDPLGEPQLVAAMGSMEVYDGQLGPGILNAISCMNRATEIAAENGMGPLAGRRQKKVLSACAGPIRNHACLHGVENPVPLETIRSSLVFQEQQVT